MNELEKNGNGFGKMVSYVKYACEVLTESLTNISKCSKLYDFTDVINYKIQCEAVRNDLLDKNKRIYFEHAPDAKFLPIIDPSIKAKMEQFR